MLVYIEKYTIANILQTLNGLKYSHSQGDFTGTKSGAVTLIYEVDQASVSDSDSMSDSESISESVSESISSSGLTLESMSDLTNGSDSLPHNNSLPNTGMVDEVSLQVFS
ncbi:TonB-dependent receptor [Weissella oryzae SG25]|uniref:TonB-dependent receptor n=1 Tax=Weissella oryzae (strain DSM 25784 / JCM 18191 / LMG 30913 / SG25) TaxID=1329250 RepID=A0A069CX92_WEIOS|nr:hypothetical protein [Weissella oryzae]GAK31808.1 TonB-dependent receptor [Weissella oryzae SG25]